MIASQIEVHAKYGGVVPEIAARHHVEAIATVIDDPECQNEMRIKGLARAATFTWDRGASLAEASFRKALGLRSQ